MKRIIVASLLALSFVSCGFGEYTLTFDRETFNRERQLWLEQNIQNYSFRFSNLGPGYRSFTIVVQDGEPRYIREDTIPDAYFPANTIDYKNGKTLYRTISGFYTKIESWAASGEKGAQESITVVYDSVYHYPIEMENHISRPSILPLDPPGNGTSVSIFLSDFNPGPEELKVENTRFFDRETFEQEQRLWLERDTRDYSFCFSYTDGFDSNLSCSVTVAVRDGTLYEYSADSPLGMNKPVLPEAQAWLLPVSAVFERIVGEADKELDGGIRMVVQYDSVYHYPAELDYYFSASNAAEDAAYSVRIKWIKFIDMEKQ